MRRYDERISIITVKTDRRLAVLKRKVAVLRRDSDTLMKKLESLRLNSRQLNRWRRTNQRFYWLSSLDTNTSTIS
jgi:hypothetical protein